MESPSVVIHLVHGTWPKGLADRLRSSLARIPFARFLARKRLASKTWLDRGSDFQRTIEQGIGTHVRFSKFMWSGANSQRARQTAAERLYRHLDRSIRRLPDASHFVVAHSHGGNVAVLALGDPTRRALPVRGVATMATPFLQFRRFRGSHVAEAFRYQPLIAFEIAVVFAVILGLTEAGWTREVFFQSAAWGALLALPASLLAPRNTWNHFRTKTGHLKNSELLVIRATGDEATILLAGAQLTGYLADTMWRICSKPLVRLFDLRPAFRLALFATYLAGATILTLGYPPIKSLPLAGHIVVQFTLLVAIFQVVGGLLLLPAAIVHALAIGPEMLLGGFVNIVRVEATPPRWEGRLANIDLTAADTTRAGLNHYIHALPQAAARIAKWADELAAESSAKQISLEDARVPQHVISALVQSIADPNQAPRPESFTQIGHS